MMMWLARREVLSVYTLVFWLSAGIFVISGCGPKQYKEDADREVYKIIDSKWGDQFGSKANYKVNDVPPSAEDLKESQAVLPKGKLSLVAALTIATVRNRDYITEKENLYLKALELTLQRHVFDPQFFGVLCGDYTRAGTDVVRTVGKSTYIDNIAEKDLHQNANFGLDWLFPYGGKINPSITADWIRFLTGDPREALTSVLAGTASQPLLRGAGRKVVQEPLTQAERDVLYQIRAFNRFRKTFLVSVITDYYRVLQAQNMVKNAENNYVMLEKAAERVLWLANAGRLPHFEVDQANQDRLNAKDNLVRSQQTYEQMLDDFKIKLGLPTDAKVELDAEELAVLEKKGTFEPQYSLKQAVEVALDRRLDLANLRDRVDDFQRKIAVAENGLLPDLSIGASANVRSSEHMRYGSVEFDRGNYAALYRLDLPLERKAERNIYRRSLIAFMQQKRSYELGIDQVKLEVRKAYRNLKETAELYQIQQKSLELAQKRVESTSLLLEAGRVTTRDLLDSQSALLYAQNARTSALVDHAIAMLTFFQDIEVLQVKPDGLWEVKTNGDSKTNK